MNLLDVSPAGDCGFGNHVDIKESAIEPITVGLSSVIKRHLHRRYVTGVCTVIVWVEWMPFLIPVHGDQSKANTRWAAFGKPVASCAKVGLAPALAWKINLAQSCPFDRALLW